MRRIVILTLIFLGGLVIAQAQQKYVLPKGVAQSQIQPGVLVFKLKQESSGYQRNAYSLTNLPFKAESIAPVPYRKAFAKNGEDVSVLRGIYKVYVHKDSDVITLCNLLMSDDEIAYAEPIFKEELLIVPSDPEAETDGGAQSYLSVIQAYEAWDLSQGSEDIIIGVIDTGADLDHEDLAGNLYVNEVELINGIDDDNNGFIDDRTGYDFADDDPDPQSDGSGHGSQVGGLAAADTDNGVGIAGLGFKSKLAPLKAFLTTTTESAGNYDAIIYAADNDYDVINLSWGSINTFSQFNQDIIDYAVLENDVVVIAAAGNSSTEVNFYPAAYEHVLAVGATKLDDTKSDFATYGNFIDISAPGSAIYTTTNDTYGNYWGSSFAAPMVAGVAGLIRSEYPNLNAEEVMERLRVTADDIDGVNADFIGKLGKGRLNAFRALNDANLKSIRVSNFTVSGENDQVFYFGDSISIDIELENFLEDIDQGVLSLSDATLALEYLTSEINFGSIAHADTTSIESISAVIASDAEPGSVIDIRVNLEDGDYTDFQQFSLTLAPDHLDLEGGQATLTLGGNGELGRVASGTAGTGLVLGTNTLASEIGLILTTGVDSVIDNAPLIFGTSKNSDFQVEQHIKPYRNSAADKYVFNTFIEQDTLGVKIEQSTMSWEELDSALVLSYRIVNNSGSAIDSLAVGMFINWELNNPLANQATWDQANTAYAFDNDSSIWAGYRILTDGVVRHAALDLSDENENMADLDSVFSDSLKYTFLVRENLESAGSDGGNDIADMLGALLTDLEPNQASTITFLLGFGRDQQEMEDRLDAAEGLFGEFEENPPVISEEVSCEGGMMEIAPLRGASFNFYADFEKQDTLGIGSSLLFGPVNSDTVIYVSAADSTYEGPLRRIDIRFLEQIARFSASTEVVYLGENDNLVTFTDESFNAIGWDWDFGNGIRATVENPTVVYNEPGNYTVTLVVENSDGCSGTFLRQVEVLYRPEPLGLSSLETCFGDDLTIAATEGNSIRIYESLTEEIPAFEGSAFEWRFVTADTLIYVSSLVNGHESHREAVTIEVYDVLPEFTIISALDSANTDYLWLVNQTPASVEASWVINGLEALGDTVVYEAGFSQLDVTLSITSGFGCSGTAREMVELVPAPLPEFTPPAIICRGDQVIVEPSNGTYFGFFDSADPEGTFMKAESIILDSLIQPVDLRIFGIDGGVPGDTLQVLLSPNAFEFLIIANPDTLYLDQDRSVDFSLDTMVFSPQWFLNDELAELLETPIFSFDTAGVYQIHVIAQDEDGCVHKASMDYLVFAETPIVLHTDLEFMISIFPNPVQAELVIDVPSEINRAYIFDLKGTLVLEFDESDRVPAKLDVSFLETGVYVIQLHLPGQVVTRKFRKE
ncbi:MAG: S8 family serine peptidase [Cytophagales bacterium]|nr:S8 family serine peptidase [Cytophagales bacterium]